MAKVSVRNALAGQEEENSPILAELKALRKAQRDSARRVEELKLRLFQLSERHWDQTVVIIKAWVKPEEEEVRK